MGSPHKLQKIVRFPNLPYTDFSSAVTDSILQFLAFSAFISLHFGFVGFHFLAFWLCGLSFPCILAWWAFISLHFGFLGLCFLSFWPCGPLFPCILALRAFVSTHFGLVGLSFPCILAFWAFISLHFGLLGLHFLAIWLYGCSFPGILAFWRPAREPPPQVAKNGPFSQFPIQRI